MKAIWRMHTTANVTNAKNVLVHIPRLVALKWNLAKGDVLRITYDEQTNAITIRPGVRG